MKILKRNSLFIYSWLLLLGQIIAMGAYANYEAIEASNIIRRNVEINQQIQGRGRANFVDLLQYVYNDYQLQNATLKQIVLNAETKFGMGQVALNVNGNPIGFPLTVPAQMSRTVFQVEGALGQIPFSQIHNLSLQLKGNFYVQSAVLIFEQNLMASRPAKILGKELFQSFSFGEEIKVRQILGLNAEYRGQKVKFVSLTVQGQSSGNLQLIINGRPVGVAQSLSYGQSFVKLEIPPYAGAVLGEDIRTLQVKIQGRMTVTSLMVGLNEF